MATKTYRKPKAKRKARLDASQNALRIVEAITGGKLTKSKKPRQK